LPITLVYRLWVRSFHAREHSWLLLFEACPRPRFTRRVCPLQAPLCRAKGRSLGGTTTIGRSRSLGGRSFLRTGQEKSRSVRAPRTTAGSISTRNTSSYARSSHRGEFENGRPLGISPPRRPELRLHRSEQLLHHIDDEEHGSASWSGCGCLAHGTRDTLTHRPSPARTGRSIARWVATHDRGDYARRLQSGAKMLGEIFQPGVRAVALRSSVSTCAMVVLKGSARQELRNRGRSRFRW